MKRLLTIGVVLLGAATITACGSDDDAGDDLSESNAEFCADLIEYERSVISLDALDPTTATKDDLQAATDEMRSARDEMIDSARDLSEAGWDIVQDQATALVDQLQDAPDDQTVAAVLDEARPQATAVRASLATVNTAVCGATPATSTG